MKVTKYINIIMGILLLTGPFTFARVCDFSKKMMNCTYSAVGVSIVGVLIIGVSLIGIIIKKNNNLFYYSIILFFYLITILIPRFIIGGCKSMDMRCNKISFPVIYLFAILGIVINIVMIIKQRIEKQNV